MPPEGKLLSRAEVIAGDPMPRPYVVKPFNEGSSVGVTIIKAGDNAKPFAGIDWPFGDVVLAERFIPGRELTCGVMGDEAMAVTELRPHSGFYDYANKYTGGMTDHLIPAPLPADVYAECQRMAVAAHQVLGCRGVSRSDFRYDDTGEGGVNEIYLLETNTQPGMTELSLVPEMAKHAGISYPQLVSWMVEHAAMRRVDRATRCCGRGAAMPMAGGMLRKRPVSSYAARAGAQAPEIGAGTASDDGRRRAGHRHRNWRHRLLGHHQRLGRLSDDPGRPAFHRCLGRCRLYPGDT